MSESLEELLRVWRGRGVVTHYDEPTATWCFIAIHDVTLGPAVGGCRMRRYHNAVEALRDAMRLAQGMTYKWAAIDVPYGGGKAVLAVSRPVTGEARTGLLRRFGRLVELLGGNFATGVDMGTTPEDMRTLRRVTRHVMGVSEGGQQSADPGPYTALGVYSGLRALVEHVWNEASLENRTVLVQGVGDVGRPLAQLLAEGGASLKLSDLDADRVGALASELRAGVIPVDEVLETPCDVFAPCAVGGVLNSTTIPRLACRAIAGSANNQLGEASDAEALRRRGIIYAPDYIVNAGGAIAFWLLRGGEHEDAAIRARVIGVGDSLRQILADAAARAESPEAAARRRAEHVLERARVR